MRKISSFALFAFVLPLTGCPGGDDGESDTVVGTTTMTPATDTAGDTVAETAADTAADTAEDTAAATGDTTAGGGGAGFCGQTCEAVADCVPMGGAEADYACTDGFCEFVGEIPDPPACDDTTCPAAIGGACADVNGVNQCTFPCTDGGTECDALMLECSGMDDAGNSICAAPPCGGAAEGEPCEFPGGAGQYGTCTDGVCTCTDDAECTLDGFGCNN